MMDAAKALRRQMEINHAKSRAIANGGCPTCFLQFDPERPSCNTQECANRWSHEKARRAALAATPPSQEKP